MKATAAELLASAVVATGAIEVAVQAGTSRGRAGTTSPFRPGCSSTC
jgi:hypothetical protein